MSCRRYRDSVVLLADGELTEDAARDARMHVDGCESCRATLAELERLETLLTPATPGNPTVAESRFWRSFDADLALRVHRTETPFWRRAFLLPVPAVVAMSAVVVTLGAMVLHERRANDRLSAKNAHLTAALKSVRDEGVLAVSPRLTESLAALDALVNETPDRPDRALEDRGRLPSVASAPDADERSRFMAEPMGMSRRAALPPLASTQLAAGMEIRFVDSELVGADMY